MGIIRRHPPHPAIFPTGGEDTGEGAYVCNRSIPYSTLNKIRRAAEQVAQRVREDYPQVKTESDLDTVEVGDDAYVWITVDTPDSIDDVRAAACNYAGDFWEAEDIFIVPCLR